MFPKLFPLLLKLSNGGTPATFVSVMLDGFGAVNGPIGQVQRAAVPPVPRRRPLPPGPEPPVPALAPPRPGRSAGRAARPTAPATTPPVAATRPAGARRADGPGRAPRRRPHLPGRRPRSRRYRGAAARRRHRRRRCRPSRPCLRGRPPRRRPGRARGRGIGVGPPAGAAGDSEEKNARRFDPVSSSSWPLGPHRIGPVDALATEVTSAAATCRNRPYGQPPDFIGPILLL